MASTMSYFEASLSKNFNRAFSAWFCNLENLNPSWTSRLQSKNTERNNMFFAPLKFTISMHIAIQAGLQAWPFLHLYISSYLILTKKYLRSPVEEEGNKLKKERRNRDQSASFCVWHRNLIFQKRYNLSTQPGCGASLTLSLFGLQSCMESIWPVAPGSFKLNINILNILPL